MTAQLDLFAALPDTRAPNDDQRSSLAVAHGWPVWWTPADAEAIERYHEWKDTEWCTPLNGMDPGDHDQLPETRAGHARMSIFLDAHIAKWCCRRCRHWQSKDGTRGECTYTQPPPDEYGPLGVTIPETTCEEWDPRTSANK